MTGSELLAAWVANTKILKTMSDVELSTLIQGVGSVTYQALGFTPEDWARMRERVRDEIVFRHILRFPAEEGQ